MNNSSGYRYPNFAKVILDIFEARIEPFIGKDAIIEIKKPYTDKEISKRLNRAILNAENRFLLEYPTNDISQVLQQLSLADIPSIHSDVWQFFESPNELKIQTELINQIRSILPKNYPIEKIVTAAQEYLYFLREEMIVSIPELREQWNTLLLYKLGRNSEKSLNILNKINDKLSIPIADEIPGENTLDPTSNISTLVDLFSKDFIGRSFAFEAIDRFMSEKTNGYFLIEGDPGAGKSSIIAQLTKRKNCIAHFNNRAIGVTSSQFFLESILWQLVARFSLPYQKNDIHQRMSADGRFLIRLLQEASQSIKPDQNILIAVDALDEVENIHQDAANILFLPTQLPEKIFFILSSRRKVVHLVTHAPLLFFDLSEHHTENERDIREFIAFKIDRSQKLKTFIKEKGLSQKTFTDHLTTKSDLNFMYVKSVLNDMENGWFFDVELRNLPQGLIKYYEDHWLRMGMFGEMNQKKHRMVKVIYVLAEVLYPVSRKEIAILTGEDDIFVQSVLDDWLQFLHIEIDNQEKCYSIYHNSFRDFLYRKDIVTAAGISISDINTLIARSLRNNLGY